MMDKTNITVTMPVTEYENLCSIEQSYNKIIRLFECANVEGEAVMTKELEQIIKDIYC